jgi:hypothetical protein
MKDNRRYLELELEDVGDGEEDGFARREVADGGCEDVRLLIALLQQVCAWAEE